jgi:hypothetical protein
MTGGDLNRRKRKMNLEDLGKIQMDAIETMIKEIEEALK